jgi:hypothetical protein
MTTERERERERERDLFYFSRHLKTGSYVYFVTQKQSHVCVTFLTPIREEVYVLLQNLEISILHSALS